MYGSLALRISELVRLDLLDVDLANRVLFIRDGKGRKDRVVPVGRIAATLIGRYVRTRRLPAPSQRRALFVDHDGRRVTADAVRRRILAPALHRAGIAKHVTPHVLRHSCAVHMLEGGAGVREVQVLLGHAKLSTTQMYLAVVPIELKKAHAAAHPSEHQQIPPSIEPSRLTSSRWNPAPLLDLDDDADA